MHILDTPSKSDECIVMLLEDSPGRNIRDLQTMRESMRAQFKKLEKRRKEDELIKEVAWASGSGKQFKGTCFKCGKQGHKGADC